MKNHLKFIIAFSIILFVFLSPLIFMRSGFIAGDSLVQFYPWSKVYSEAIKNFQFPFWTRYFQSGFPLMAEGQVGGFYPLNILLFFLLPFKVAYNYSIVLHFVLAGLFTYLYSRRMGATQGGGFVAALLFCFGSAYAGCFYNIITLRTLIWFPLVLLLIEHYIDTRKFLIVILCGIVAGMQFLAGFLQLAAYSCVFYIIYILYGFRINKIPLKVSLLSIATFTLSAFLVSAPQLALTYNLAQASGRSGATLGFALWHSFPPPCFLSAIFPRWMGFMGAHFYIGVFGILFLIYAISEVKVSPKIRPLLIVAAISLLGALGKYNPLYVLLLKVTKFYSFRNPSKFLFFGLFALSVLSGLGFSRFFDNANKARARIAARIFAMILSCSLFIFSIAKIVFYYFGEKIILLIQSYAKKYVVGKAHHRYDISVYMDKAKDLYYVIVKGTYVNDKFVFFSLLLVLIGLAVSIIILKRRKSLKSLKKPILCLLILDIFIYSFYGIGFRGNIKPFSYIRPAHKEILDVLRSDKDLFRIYPFGLKDDYMPWWARPNSNILYNIDSIGAYSPLVQSDYKQNLSPLAVVDDSLGLLSPEDTAIAGNYRALRLLNVKYIISSRDLTYRFLKRVVTDNRVHLYKMLSFLPRIFFTYRIEGNIKKGPKSYLTLKEYRDGYAKVDVDAGRDGFVVFSENYFTGWKAYINGVESEIIEVQGLVQAIEVSKGKHKVVFEYKPSFFQE
ncbi:YfhO family protein [Candidatus Omnitrophota bacterium]